MFLVIKTGIFIVLLSSIAMYGLQAVTRREAKRPIVAANYATVFAFASLCVSQPWLAFLGLGSLTAYFSRYRAIAAGMVLFLIITIPGVSILVMAGSLQLINFSAITASILGLLVGSFFWTGKFRQKSIVPDLPAYMIALLLTFIAARNTSLTNILRTCLENIIAFGLPYYLVRRSLKDAISIRYTFIFIIAAGLSVSAVAIFESIRVWPMYQGYAMNFGTLINAGVKMRGGMLRASGPSMNPPLSSAILAMCFVTAVASRDIFKSKRDHRLVLAILAAGLFMMQSRVGWLGAVCGSIGVVVSKRGAKAFVGYIPILVVAGGLAYAAAMLDSGIANMIGFSSDAKGSSEYRSKLSELGWQIVKAHPFVGQPVDVVEGQMESLRQGEGIVDFTNGYLAVALFSGLPGLLVLVGGLVFHWYKSQTCKRAARIRGAGSFADLGMGIVFCIGVMLPYVPTDYRIMITMLLLLALTNAVISYSHVGLMRPLQRQGNSSRGLNLDSNRIVN